jgi:hypothetical protein
MKQSDLRLIQAEINNALSEIASKYNMVSMRVGAIGFGGSSHQVTHFHAKIEAIVEEIKQAADLSILGLPTDAIGKTIRYQGREFTITGVNPKKPKFGVQATTAQGKTYNLVTESVIRILQGNTYK